MSHRNKEQLSPSPDSFGIIGRKLSSEKRLNKGIQGPYDIFFVL